MHIHTYKHTYTYIYHLYDTHTYTHTHTHTHTHLEEFAHFRHKGLEIGQELVATEIFAEGVEGVHGVAFDLCICDDVTYVCDDVTHNFIWRAWRCV